MNSKNVVLAITGASGVVYAVRLLEVLVAAGYEVYLTISPSARTVLKQELDLSVDLEDFSLSSLLLTPEKVSDAKLDMLRSLAGISSHESNVLAFDMGTPGQVRVLPLRRHDGADRQRIVPNRRHGDLSLLGEHAGSGGARQRQ